jgi:hypothetical protein
MRMRMRKMIHVVAGCVAAAAVVGCNDDSPTGPSRADVARTDGFAAGPNATTGFEGTWEGTFVVDRCTGTGSAEDVTCRQRFPRGNPILMRLTISDGGPSVTGKLTLGDIAGNVDGTSEPSGALSLGGSLRDEVMTIVLTSWHSQLQDGTMTGSFAFRVRPRVFPGTATVAARIRVLGRVPADVGN